MRQVTTPFLSYLVGTQITTDPDPTFNCSGETWIISEHLEEKALLRGLQDIARHGPTSTAAKFLCYRKDDPTKKPGFMRIYRQLPNPGTEYFDPQTKALQAVAKRENDELQAFQRLARMNCTVTPALLGYSEATQGIQDPVPGGFSVCIIWDQVPGESLSDDCFWALDRGARDSIRRTFRQAAKYFIPCGVEPLFGKITNVIFDPVSGSIHICGFYMASLIPPPVFKWSDIIFVQYELVKVAESLDHAWIY